MPSQTLATTTSIQTRVSRPTAGVRRPLTAIANRASACFIDYLLTRRDPRLIQRLEPTHERYQGQSRLVRRFLRVRRFETG